MKTKVKLIIIIPIIFTLSFVFVAANKNNKPKEIKEYELELKFSFPSKDLEKEDIYFFGASHICSDSSGNIYISDSKARNIFKFDSSGNFLVRIGREGQGPGEFNNPRSIRFSKDLLVVSDNNNHRIQFLDSNGIYVRSIKYKGMAPWDMAVNDNGLVFVAPIRRQSHAPLIDVYSQDGNLLYSFGEPIELKHRSTMFNQVSLATNENGKVLVAFLCWPIVREYSEKGELEKEYRIEDKNMREAEEFNLDQQKPMSRGQPTRMRSVINGFYAKNESFYLLKSRPQIEILEFNKEGELEAIYRHKPKDKYGSGHFIIKNNGNEKLFYILQKFPENKVDVYGMNKK